MVKMRIIEKIKEFYFNRKRKKMLKKKLKELRKRDPFIYK